MAKSLKTAIVAGVTFYGPTVADARQTGEKQIAAFVAESLLGPSVYSVHGRVVLVWADLAGWSYSVDPQERSAGLARAVCSGFTSREECILSAIGHAAEYAWDYTTPDDEAHYVAAYAPVTTFRNVARAISERVGQTKWRRAWKAAKDAGHTAEEAHAIACKARLD